MATLDAYVIELSSLNALVTAMSSDDGLADDPTSEDVIREFLFLLTKQYLDPSTPLKVGSSLSSAMDTFMEEIGTWCEENTLDPFDIVAILTLPQHHTHVMVVAYRSPK